jgi:hypothetical protein
VSKPNAFRHHNTADSESPDDYEDGQIVTEAIRQLTAIVEKYKPNPEPRERAMAGTHAATAAGGPANPLTRAFFMAVGLHRPHMDWVVPQVVPVFYFTWLWLWL